MIRILKLDVGCGSSFEGAVRIDIRITKAVNLVADAHFLPLKDKSFSYVRCTEVLEHLESPYRALKEIHRVLEKDGIVFITVPNITEMRRLIPIIRNPLKIPPEYARISLPIKAHRQGWDAIGFNNLVKQLGFKVLEINWFDRKGSREDKSKSLNPVLKHVYLNPVLKHILPKTLYHTHMKIILQKCTASRLKKS